MLVCYYSICYTCYFYWFFLTLIESNNENLYYEAFSTTFGELADALFQNNMVGLKSSNEFDVFDCKVIPVCAVGAALFKELEIIFSNL